MSRYDDLRKESIEHGAAAGQKAEVSPFIVSFLQEMVKFLGCPPGSFKFIGKDRLAKDNPADVIWLTPTQVWTATLRVYPTPEASTVACWDIGLEIRKKWDLLLVRTLISGPAGSRSKSWKVQAGATAPAITEMCEWAYEKLKSSYQDFDYFPR